MRSPPSPTPALLAPGFSVYLDLVRFVAAVMVFLEHARLSGLVTGLPWKANLASEAVAAFFVLSGYIIAATTDPARGWRAFAIARCARLYSVAVPAFALGLALKLAYTGTLGDGALAAVIKNDLAWWKLVIMATFTGEIWTLKIDMPWDGPIWSLDYEAFYYLIFGILVFGRGRARLVGAAILAMIAGPKILILAPCWALGVFLARRPTLSFGARWMAWVALIAAPLGLWLVSDSGLQNYIKYQVLWPHLPGFWRLQDAENFASFYLDAVLVAVGFVAARQLQFSERSVLMRIAPPIRWLAGFTFSLYLFHRPFQYLFAEFYQATPGSWPVSLALLSIILLFVVMLGTFTEKRKEIWRRFFACIFRTHAASAKVPLDRAAAGVAI